VRFSSGRWDLQPHGAGSLALPPQHVQSSWSSCFPGVGSLLWSGSGSPAPALGTPIAQACWGRSHLWQLCTPSPVPVPTARLSSIAAGAARTANLASTHRARSIRRALGDTAEPAAAHHQAHSMRLSLHSGPSDCTVDTVGGASSSPRSLHGTQPAPLEPQHAALLTCLCDSVWVAGLIPLLDPEDKKALRCVQWQRWRLHQRRPAPPSAAPPAGAMGVGGGALQPKSRRAAPTHPPSPRLRNAGSPASVPAACSTSKCSTSACRPAACATTRAHGTRVRPGVRQRRRSRRMQHACFGRWHKQQQQRPAQQPG
jgi:hypothetical protein